MRKTLLALFLALSLTLGLAACGSTPAPEADNAASDSAPSESTPQTEASGGVLVAYFSATGNTEGVAQQLAGLLSADLYAITPAEPYTEADLDYTNPNSRSQVEGSNPDARPALAGEALDLSGYDTIFLGYPIWNGQAPKLLSTFLETYDCTGKTIVPFCTSGSSPIGSSAEALQALAPGAHWLAGQRFAADASQDPLSAWVDSLPREYPAPLFGTPLETGACVGRRLFLSLLLGRLESSLQSLPRPQPLDMGGEDGDTLGCRRRRRQGVRRNLLQPQRVHPPSPEGQRAQVPLNVRAGTPHCVRHHPVDLLGHVAEAAFLLQGQLDGTHCLLIPFVVWRNPQRLEFLMDQSCVTHGKRLPFDKDRKSIRHISQRCSRIDIFFQRSTGDRQCTLL